MKHIPCLMNPGALIELREAVEALKKTDVLALMECQPNFFNLCGKQWDHFYCHF